MKSFQVGDYFVICDNEKACISARYAGTINKVVDRNKFLVPGYINPGGKKHVWFEYSPGEIAYCYLDGIRHLTPLELELL